VFPSERNLGPKRFMPRPKLGVLEQHWLDPPMQAIPSLGVARHLEVGNMRGHCRFPRGQVLIQEGNSVSHDSVAFHRTNGVFNTNSDRGNTTIGCLLGRSEFLSMWCFLQLEDCGARQVKSPEAFIFMQAVFDN
jgi:hypothetical protein